MSDMEKNIKEEYIIIEDWYIYPDYNSIRLSGKVQNHSNFEKDTKVTTSNIVFINDIDKYIQTESCNKYKLGKPNDKFMNEDIYGLLKEHYDSNGGK